MASRSNAILASCAVLLVVALAVVSRADRAGAETRKGKIAITVTGLANDDGQVILLLYDDKKGFPTKTSKAWKRRVVGIEKKKAHGSFASVPYGTYAVTAIHDEDANGKLLTNLIGMPKEGVGVSGNASGMPKWKKAKFVLDGQVEKLKIRIRYL